MHILYTYTYSFPEFPMMSVNPVRNKAIIKFVPKLEVQKEHF